MDFVLRRSVLILGIPSSYNIYGGNQDLKAVFGDIDRFIRWVPLNSRQSCNLIISMKLDGVLFFRRRRYHSSTSKQSTKPFKYMVTIMVAVIRVVLTSNYRL